MKKSTKEEQKNKTIKAEKKEEFEMKYQIGDIVWVAEFEEEEKEEVNHHFFVVIDDDGQLIPADYFGFVVSSNTSKSKENSIFKYNESLKKDSNNKLDYDSIVKCDKLFQIPKKTISYKLGSVNAQDMIRFLQAYKDFIASDKK